MRSLILKLHRNSHVKVFLEILIQLFFFTNDETQRALQNQLRPMGQLHEYDINTRLLNILNFNPSTLVKKSSTLGRGKSRKLSGPRPTEKEAARMWALKRKQSIYEDRANSPEMMHGKSFLRSPETEHNRSNTACPMTKATRHLQKVATRRLTKAKARRKKKARRATSRRTRGGRSALTRSKSVMSSLPTRSSCFSCSTSQIAACTRKRWCRSPCCSRGW